MRNSVIAGLTILTATCTSAFAQGTVPLAPDIPTKIGDKEAVCTGVGLEARQNPAWASYPVKIEVAGRGGQYLGDVTLTLSRESHELATVHCDGPWILFRTLPGRYQVEAHTEGQSAKSIVLVPASGQARIILRFPELGGEVGPAPAKAAS